jgi:hypothetical protein
MKKLLFCVILFAIAFQLQAQNVNHPSSALVQAKVQQATFDNNNALQRSASVTSLPEQDLPGAIPVCQTVYSVSNSYSGDGLISEISSNTCFFPGEKNSVWYSFTCFSPGRLKFVITPNDLNDDYDYLLFDLTGHTYSDVQNGIITPIICNFSAAPGKTGLDSSGISYNESAGGSRFNPLLNLTVGHTYVLNISNFSSSVFGYKLNFAGTTANIGSTIPIIQNIVSYCGTDSLTVKLSASILNSSIQGTGTDFVLSSSTGTYNVVSAHGMSGTGTSNSVVLKLDNLISSTGTYSLSVINGTDGNTLLNPCNVAMSLATYTFNNTFIYPLPTPICQNQTFTLSALGATSYTWTGGLVPPAQINDQNLSIIAFATGNSTFTLETFGACGANTQTFSIAVNSTPNTVITTTTPVSCAGSSVNLQASGATNYIWSVGTAAYDANLPNYQTQTTSANFMAKPLQQNIYSVTGTNSNGCSTIGTYTLSVLATPSITISGPDSVCAGSPAILSFSGTADTYTWSNGAINVPTISVAPMSSANFNVVGSISSTGCTVSKSKYIFVKKISISNPTKYVCSGDSILITAPVALSYTWNTGATTNTIYAKPTIPTTYTVWCNTSNCGVLTATSLVTFYAQPTIPIYINNMTNTVCTGNDSTYVFYPITTSGLTSYTWSTGSHSNVGSPAVNLPYSASNNVFSISVAATNSLGCTAYNSLTYSVFPKPRNVYVTSSNDICSGNTATLTGHGADTYKWAYQGSYGTPASPTYVITQTATTNYYLYGIDVHGCIGDQVLYTLATNTASALSAVANPSIICSGFSTVLSAQGSGIFHWFNSDTSSTVLSMNMNYGTGFFNTPGTYTYYVSSTCSNGSRVPVIVQVNQTPTITVTAIKDTVCSAVPFQLNATGANTYTWSTGNINGSAATYSIINNGISYFPGYYQVTGKALNGCFASKTKTISSYPRQIIYPVANPTMVCAGMSSTISLIGVPSYTWSTGVVSNTTIVYPNGTFTTATYTALNVYGCNQVEAMYVPVDNSFAGINMASQYQCSGTTTTLSVAGFTNYTWNTGLSNANLSISNGSAGAYTFSVNGTNQYGCARQSSVTYTVLQSPSVSLTPNYNPICNNVSLYLNVNGTADTYTVTTPSYSTTNVGFSYGLINSSATFTTVGRKVYLPTYNWTCYTTFTNQVQAFAATSVSLAATNTLLCLGETATLSALGVPNYTFSGGPVNTSYVVTPTSSNNYYLTGKDVNGCVTTKSITLNVNSTAIFFTGSSQAICPGQSVTLSVFGNNSVNYNWQPGNVTTNSVVVYPSATTIYSVTGTNTVCAYTRTVLVTVNQSPTVSLSASGTLTCVKQPTVYATASPSVTYNWYMRINNVNYSMSVGNTATSVVVNQAADYYCSVISTTSSCASTGSTAINIDNAIPLLTFTATSPICAGTSAQISATGAAAYSLNYSGTSANSFFNVYPLVTTTYTLRGVGINSCVAVSYPTIIVNPNPTVSISGAGPICDGDAISLTSSGASSYIWSTGATSGSINETPGTTTVYSVTGSDANNCIGTASTQVVVNSTTINLSDGTICEGESFTITPTGAISYTYSSGSDVVSPLTTSIYSVTGTGNNNCVGSATMQVNVNATPTLVISASSGSVCEGSSVVISAAGATTFSWSNGAMTSSVSVMPSGTSIYTVVGSNGNNCNATETVSIVTDNTCQDVWPGDANSDGVADNIDILELGLHYTQTGAPRSSMSNSWQSYFSNNWTGTISNGKNINHSDCNGDGVISDDDTLAVFNNYGAIHTFKPNSQATTASELSIVPDQNFVVAGNWGSSSVYLGESATPVNDVNGVAFTVSFDNTLIEPNSVWIEYPASFINVGDQNLDFKKLNFAGNNLYTATTHTINNNVSGNGLIAILHYRILTNLSTDEVLNLGLIQANKSDASGTIAPLTVGSGTLMAIGASVGVKETFENKNILISPNPMNNFLNICFNASPQNTKIEIYNSIGALVLSEIMGNKTNAISTSDLSSGMYFVKVLENDKVIAVKKVVKE